MYTVYVLYENIGQILLKNYMDQRITQYVYMCIHFPFVIFSTYFKIQKSV